VATDMGVGDHACWGYDDRAGYLEQVVLYLAEGGEAGDRLWYLGDKPRDVLMADLQPLARREELLAGGQLLVSQAREVYGPVGTFDARAVLDRFRAEAARAVADGYRSLRVATDVTALAEDHAAGRRMVGHELASDSVITAGPLIVLCGYAQRRIGADFPAIAAVHPLLHGGTAPVPLSLHWDPAGLRLTGEVDYAATGLLQAVLHAAVSVAAGPLVIDLSDLGFIDVVDRHS
jgi:hypothetical protein